MLMLILAVFLDFIYFTSLQFSSSHNRQTLEILSPRQFILWQLTVSCSCHGVCRLYDVIRAQLNLGTALLTAEMHMKWNKVRASLQSAAVQHCVWLLTDSGRCYI